MPLFLLSIFGGLKTALSAVLTFCSKPPGSWIAAALSLFLAFWWWGHHRYDQGIAAQIELDAKRAVKINTGQVKIVEKLRTVYLPQEAKIKTVTQTITKEVPVYVTQKDDSRCVITNGFRRLHDAAAAGELPPSPSGTDGDDSRVKLSAVLGTVADNYGTCNLALSRLKEWQQWYAENKTLWEKGK